MPTLAPVLTRDVNLFEFELLGGRRVLPPDLSAVQGLRRCSVLGFLWAQRWSGTDTRHHDINLR